MRTRTISTCILVCSRMLQSLHQHKTHIKQVGSLFSLSPKHHCSTTSLTKQTNKPHIDTRSTHISGISKSVIRKCSHLLFKKSDTSLKDFLFSLSNLSPKTTRKFWGLSELKPQDVLEILLGFESNTWKFEIELQKVGSLWGIFKWASEQGGRDFKHLHQSFQVMVSMLVRVRLFKDVEFLLSSMESQGILLDNHDIFSDLIEWHVGGNKLEKAISMYNRMRGLNLVPSLSCYRALLNYLLQMSETQLAFQAFVDMLEMGLGMGISEKGIYENVIQVLCRAGLVQEARNVIKKAFGFGMEPTYLVLDAIASGYCEKKDYNDLLSLFAEMKCAPNVVVGNKIIHSLCSNFGVEEAFVFLQELEHLGYCSDEITFGILIGWSCREGKLKNAFIYLSEILSRNLQPHVNSYNALVSGVFKEGMWKHAQDIVHEMDEGGITLNMSTFRVLLAGYCKARQFDEVKMIIGKMVDCGLIQLLSLEDPLSKAFMILGLDPLAVRMRRDNDVGFSKTEFFDNMGNGLYLEADMVEYERTMMRILDDSMIPDYNSLILKDDGLKDVAIIDELVHWGQELSFRAFSTLLRRFHASNCSAKPIVCLLDKMPKLHNQLDQETLNLLVQAHIKRGFLHKARSVYDGMVKRSVQVENKTYTALITSLCKKGNLRDFHVCWELAQSSNWLPGLGDYKTLICSLCQKEMLKEALELFEHALLAYPHEHLEIFHTLLEKLCETRFPGIAHVLFEELLARGCVLDRVAYSHLIRGFCKEKHFSEAFVVSNTMLTKNMAPDIDVTLLLIPQLCRQGYFDRAICLKDSCSRENPSISLSVQCALMSGFFNSGMAGKAANLLQEMILKGTSLNSEVFNILVQGYCSTKDLRKIGEVLGVLIRMNISISISSFRKLVSLMCMEGKIHFAFCLKELMFKQMSSSSLIVYNILIFYLFSSGNSGLVDKLLDEIQERKLQCDAVTYNYLVYGFSRCKAISSSLQYLTAMMSKELTPSNCCLRAVVISFCYEGQFREALKLSREMERRGWVHCSTVQTRIVQGLLNNSMVQEAENFLDRMLEKGLIPDNINYDNLIKRFSCCGRQDKAADLLDIMLRKGNIPNSTSYDYIIQGFCAWHKLEEALDLHNEMLGRNLKPSINTWDVLIQKFSEIGHTAKAEMLLHSLVQMGEVPSRGMFGYVVSRYRFEGNFNKASELLQTMQQYAYEPDFETHWSLISNLSKSSNKDKYNNNNHNFLSRLLSESGFAQKKDPKPNRGNKA